MPDAGSKLRGRCRWSFEHLRKHDGVHLDIGCDRGELSPLYREKSRVVCALDLNFEILKSARGAHPDVHFLAASSGALPFRGGSVGSVSLTDVLEHTDDESKTIQETKRVLREEGQFIFSVPHRGLLDFLDPFNYNRILPRTWFLCLYRLVKKKDYDTSHFERPVHRHYDLEELRRFFIPEFQILQVHQGGFLFFYIEWNFFEIVVPFLPARISRWIMSILGVLADLEYRFNFWIFASHLNLVMIKSSPGK